jgi:hypothetical protein
VGCAIYTKTLSSQQVEKEIYLQINLTFTLLSLYKKEKILKEKMGVCVFKD